MCVVKALSDGALGGAKAPWGMGVTNLIGELMVLTVIGNPLVKGALDRHGPGDRQPDLHRARGFESTVREVTVIAQSDATGGQSPEKQD
ncbi:unannotated protein [freshwater metagenome]|uniref:Unannotated protein n=1 Tax=freshwater metagenome TaxID=449393 RepID=A0A6J7Q9Z5_9ZZZZ